MDPAHRLSRRAANGERVARDHDGGRSHDLVVLDLDGTVCRLDVQWEDVRHELALTIALHGFDAGSERGMLPLLQRARELGSLELVRQVESVLERAELAGALRCDVNAELVAWLRGLCYATPVAILSLNAVSAVERALTRAGVYGRISDVVARENVDRFKPDPQGLDILLERHRARPERSLFVGDSHRDAECAATAGVPYRDVREIGVSWVDPLTVCV